MRILESSDRRSIERLIRVGAPRAGVGVQAGRIVRDVRRGGDAALARWSWRLDRLRPPFEVSARELRAGWAATPVAVRQAIRVAIRHIERVSSRQLAKTTSVAVRPGVRVELRVRPLTRVGCYVPAGRYPLPSTLLMTIVAARTAGVLDTTVACPRPSPAVLCAALEAGASRVLRIGGAQAIGALAYGTASVPKVDKIVGPGNVWVAAAKAIVASECGIDFYAGPSEIVIVSDDGRPEWIAADLIAQAEHDPDARAILITTRRRLAGRVAGLVAASAPRSGPARRALASRGAIVIANSRRDASRLVAALAPEHLVCDRLEDVDRYQPAGTVFVGPWSAQAAGDYATGSNHVLPTGGAARFRGGLSASDFVRVFAVQTLTRSGLTAIGPSAVTLATAEGLHAHAASIQRRLGARS